MDGGVNSGHFWFKVPQTYEEKKTDFKIDEKGQKWRHMGNIPCDYDGIMGVPVTFMNKFNPNQFEILGCIVQSLSTRIFIRRRK